MSGLHIGYLVQQFPPEVGAGPARVTEMSRQWTTAGARVTVITGFPARAIPGRRFGSTDPAYKGRLFAQETWESCRVLRSWLYPARRPGFAHTLINNVSFAATAALHASARLGDANVLIASSPPFFPHAAGLLVSRLRRVPLVLEVRDLWPDYLVGMGMLKPGRPETRALFALERFLLRGADHITVVTESFREHIVAKGIPHDRISVIPNGVDLERYRPADEPAPLDALQARPGAFRVGYLGTFGRGQALEIVIDAAAIVQDRDPSIRFVLAGDGLERERLLAHAARRRVTNLTLHEPIPREYTRAFYNSCDACLVPLAPVPVFETTIPSKIFEVMACERFIIGAFRGEARAIVERSGAGLTVDPGDAGGIAEAVLHARAMPAGARAAAGARGRAYAAEHYDRNRLAARYLEILTNVARGSQAAPHKS